MEDSSQERELWVRAKSEHLRLLRGLKTHRKTKRTRANQMGDYEVIRLLGKGSFGLVQLVRHRDVPSSILDEMEDVEDENSVHRSQAKQSIDLDRLHKEVFAMKVIRKSDMLRKCQEGHLRAERDFLVASEQSRWVVPLIESFQDNDHLYLVMEYMVGGDFLGLLVRYEVLTEEMTRFYIAEMILCIEEVHKMKWVHRDIKPDNFLISSSGHLKISDFGLAFDGHWSHNQNYFRDTRWSLIQKLGLEITGDSQDVEESNKHTRSKASSGMPDIDQGMRPGDSFILDHLNSTWKRRLARTIVGTSQYMAPEVIVGHSYDGRCD